MPDQAEIHTPKIQPKQNLGQRMAQPDITKQGFLLKSGELKSLLICPQIYSK